MCQRQTSVVRCSHSHSSILTRWVVKDHDQEVEKQAAWTRKQEEEEESISHLPAETLSHIWLQAKSMYSHRGRQQSKQITMRIVWMKEKDEKHSSLISISSHVALQTSLIISVQR